MTGAADGVSFRERPGWRQREDVTMDPAVMDRGLLFRRCSVRAKKTTQTTINDHRLIARSTARSNEKVRFWTETVRVAHASDAPKFRNLPSP